jgi:alpha-galactosidase
MDGMVAKKRFVNGQPTSLCDLGYCDVGLDDNWQDCGAGADGYSYHYYEGLPLVNFQRFPNMTAMTEHAHKLGLTAGWYHNNCICSEKKEATKEMYAQDVYFLTDVFQFDGVKIDGCGTQGDIDMWANLINKTGRKVVIERKRTPKS